MTLKKCGKIKSRWALRNDTGRQALDPPPPIRYCTGRQALGGNSLEKVTEVTNVHDWSIWNKLAFQGRSIHTCYCK